MNLVHSLARMIWDDHPWHLGRPYNVDADPRTVKVDNASWTPDKVLTFAVRHKHSSDALDLATDDIAGGLQMLLAEHKTQVRSEIERDFLSSRGVIMYFGHPVMELRPMMSVPSFKADQRLRNFFQLHPLTGAVGEYAGEQILGFFEHYYLLDHPKEPLRVYQRN